MSRKLSHLYVQKSSYIYWCFVFILISLYIYVFKKGLRHYLLHITMICNCAFDLDFSHTDDEFGEKTVCVLLDGEESEIVFIDHPSTEMSVSSYDGIRCYNNVYLVFVGWIFFFCFRFAST